MVSDGTEFFFSLILILIFWGTVSFTWIRLKDRDGIVKNRFPLTFQQVDVICLLVFFLLTELETL